LPEDLIHDRAKPGLHHALELFNLDKREATDLAVFL
jgi:hypothetical protein